MKKVIFDVIGMTCSSCSAHVERAVNSLNGIKNVSVNLLSNSMNVEYDDKILNNEQIIKAVVEAGYNAKEKNDFKNKNEKKDNKDATKELIKSMKKKLIISICFLIPLMYIAMYHMLNDWFGLPIPNFINNLFHGSNNALNFAFTQFLLVLPIIYANKNYFIVGFKRLFKGSPNMDSLIALGSAASTLYGIFAIYMIGYGLGHGDLELVDKYRIDIYFESAGTILTLITLGKYLETKSKLKTSDAITKLINLAPKTAIVIKNNIEEEMSIDDINEGDIILIKPGGSIPVDGVIIEGNSSVDESSITGESIPVLKEKYDKVISGTINKNGFLKVQATNVRENTTLAQIIKLVEEASNSKAPISKLADKVSGIFVPIVILISTISFITWMLAGQTFEFALSTAIAVLVISCPCALGLATPVAIMVGTGKGADKGILIKSAESLELLHEVNTIVLDKTGTVTEGKPKVIEIIINTNTNIELDEEDLLKIAGSLEKNSEHPLAEAILEKANNEKIKLLEIDEFISVSGRGVKGKIEGVDYLGGNIQFMHENGIDVSSLNEKSNAFERKGKTVIYFSTKENLLGIIVVADTIKVDSKLAIDALKNKKIDIVMLTGDNKLVAKAIGKELGIEKIIAEVLPADKEKEVARLQEKGNKVAFVGDGINDSPALVRADVGIAIGSGTDIAVESADIVLMKNSLKDVVTAINLSKAVIRNIKMNLFWAFFYNSIGIPIAAGIFYESFGLKLNPMIGAAAMSLSSVCVVSNALRIRKFKSIFDNKSKDTSHSKENAQVLLNDKKMACENEKCEMLINKEKENNNMDIITKKINIEGMQCNHCKMTVEKVLNAIEGVKFVEVSLEEKNAKIKCIASVNESQLVDAIKEAGFEVKGIE